MDVHLHALRCFTAVAEHLSFTRAAESLYVSQSALSKQIRSLEAQLRVELFARDRHSVRLTLAGRALLPGSTAVLQAWAGAEADLASAQQAARADLVVGLHLGVGRGLLPDVRTRLAATSPPTGLRIRQLSWRDPTCGLGAGAGERQVDASFVWLPLPEPERFRWVPVAREPRRLLLRADHPLAGQGVVAFTDLLDERFLALPDHVGPAREHLLGVAERGGRPALVGAEIASTEEAVEALLAGLGIFLVAEGNVPTLRRDGIAVLDVTGLPDLELVLAWRREDTRPTLGVLVDAVRASVDAAR